MQCFKAGENDYMCRHLESLDYMQDGHRNGSLRVLCLGTFGIIVGCEFVD